MTYRTEFPDFDPKTLPVIPEGWTDQSWHNDACPSFNAGHGKVVFIDFIDPALKEFEDTKRFTVHADPEVHDSNDVLFETDDWSACLAFVLGERFADVLKEWLTVKEFAEMKALNQTAEYADGCCASQNYCDANMAMDQAWREMFGENASIDGESDEQTALWNAAWESARKRHIGCDPGPKPDGALHMVAQ